MPKKSKKVEQQAIPTRPPIVVVLGHVDHGKTTLLDTIRKTQTAAQEHGGITQAIGAYQAQVKTKEGERLVTFIDTPGHEAFTAMRSRGTSVADIAILVVSGDDGVMPQTKEAIGHIKAAAIPTIVAINKVDLPGADIEKVKRQLAKEDVLVEGYGGDVVVVPISAKLGQGIPQLLEMLILVSDLSQKPLDADKPFSGVVIESRLDRRRGSLATIIVKAGTLAVGDHITTAGVDCRVRGMVDEFGQMVQQASPGKPVEVLGWDEVPPVGSLVTAGKSLREADTPLPSGVPEKGEKGVLNITIKANTQGSLEALKVVLPAGATILSEAVGDISESDVLFAKTTGSIIIGFGVRVLAAAQKLAGLERVIVKTDTIIYRLAEEIQDVVTALQSGGLEELLGEATVLTLFSIKNQKIAGVRVASERLARGDLVKVMRAEEEIGRGRITSLRVGKNDATRVEVGAECGIIMTPPLDFAPGDAIISYRK